jgi:hypothetical protein
MNTASVLGSLTTFGYANKTTLWEVQAAMHANPRALIIDTRLAPNCRWSNIWQRQSLEIAWEKRYCWRGDWLGNVNYHDVHLPIQLANVQEGIPWLIRGLEKGFTLLLLCGCANYETCHRKVIYDAVQAQLHTPLPEYTSGQRVKTPGGIGVIDPSIPTEGHRARNRYAVVFDGPTTQRYFFPFELEPCTTVQPSFAA